MQHTLLCSEVVACRGNDKLERQSLGATEKIDDAPHKAQTVPTLD